MKPVFNAHIINILPVTLFCDCLLITVLPYARKKNHDNFIHIKYVSFSCSIINLYDINTVLGFFLSL
jgi:hypothetical protein